jgi:hypothetical protein
MFTCAFALMPVMLIFFVGMYLLEQVSSRLGDTLYPDSGTSTHVTSVDPLLPTVSKESDFPDSWWTGDEVFELEKRAIFSKVGINQKGHSPRRSLPSHLTLQLDMALRGPSRPF